jgi:hypothetical protein
VLPNNIGAFIWSDGTNYHALILPVGRPLLAENNLADVGDAETARDNLGLGTAAVRADTDFPRTDAAQSLTAAQKVQVQQNAGIPAIMRSYLAGLTLSTAGSSATFGVADGVATDSANADVMSLASSYTKTTSAWAVGSGNGSLDTGSIANNTWYHVWLIKRTDTNVVDVLISLSATSPTMPTNYTLKRRIGSMKTNASAQWVAFTQNGDEFLWATTVLDVSIAAISTTAASVTLSVPTGVKVMALFSGLMVPTNANYIYFYALDRGAKTATVASGNISLALDVSGQAGGTFSVRSNTSAQIGVVGNNPAGTYNIGTYGWMDTRGRYD